MANNEQWSWKKLIGGVFDGRNYAKSLVFLICSSIIITICYSVFTVVSSRFAKKQVSPVQTIGTNQGTVNTTNSSEEKKGWQLFGGLIQVNN